MELSHTLEVRQNLFIRAFIWFYDLKPPYGLNTCKLFWGGIGMIVFPLIALVLSPFILVACAIGWSADKIKMSNEAHSRARQEAYLAMTIAEREAYDNPPKSTRAEWLEKLSAVAGVVWFKVQTPVTWFFRVLIGAVALAGLGLLAHLLITTLPGLPWGDILSLAWKIILVITAIVVLVYLVVRGFEIWREKHPAKPKPVVEKKPSVLKAVFASIHNHTCANVEVKD